MLPLPIKNFVEIFSRLPSVGPRAATRLSFHILNLDAGPRRRLLEALNGLDSLDRCPDCFFVKEKESKVCAICSDKSRDSAIVAVVEKETDALTFEKSGEHKGTYLLIGELAPTGILEPWQKERITRLGQLIKNGRRIDEIITAASPGVLGDVFYETIRREFSLTVRKITRLGRGIPTGGEIEFTDPETLRDAIKRRL